MAWAVGCSTANQIVSVPIAHALTTKKLCFGLWPGLVLELPKSLAVTRIFFFMVYDGNYFNCSTLYRHLETVLYKLCALLCITQQHYSLLMSVFWAGLLGHNGCKTVWLSEALLVYGDMTWTILAATIDSLDELRKCIKSAFLLSRTPRAAGQ
jgi:hypothetical protein